MNFVAHVEVAAIVSAAADRRSVEEVLLGSALPDLASMGGFRLAPDRRPGPLADGVDLHHRTDTVFHDDPRVRGLMARLRDALRAAGLERGPARACGHVGVELLLDGVLLGSAPVRHRATAMLGAVADPAPEVLDVVATSDRPDWAAHLARVADRLRPDLYQDPEDVAGVLHRICSRRPRLAFTDADIPVVAGALRRLRPDVVRDGWQLVETTASAIGSSGRSRSLPAGML